MVFGAFTGNQFVSSHFLQFCRTWKDENLVYRLFDNMPIQIANELKTVLQTDDVAVVIDAVHLCVSSKGVRDIISSPVTAEYSGGFLKGARRDEFLKYLN